MTDCVPSLPWLGGGQGTVVDHGRHLAVVEAANRRVVLERDLGHFVLCGDKMMDEIYIFTNLDLWPS